MPRIPTELATVFDEFVAGPEKLRDAVRDLDATILNKRPPGEEWSIRDIVMHMTDAELVQAVRFRLALGSEEDVEIPVYDQELFKRRLHYLFRDVEVAMMTLDQVRFGNAELLQQLSKDTWQKTAIHPRDGRVTIATLLEKAVAHTAAHISQIGDFRAATA